MISKTERVIGGMNEEGVQTEGETERQRKRVPPPLSLPLHFPPVENPPEKIEVWR